MKATCGILLIGLAVAGISTARPAMSAGGIPQPADKPAKPLSPAEAGNAYYVLRKAGAAIVDGKYLGTKLTPAQKSRLAGRNREALELTQRALKLPFRPPQDTLAVEAGQQFGYFSGLRQLARLLVLQSDVAAARGDCDGATRACLEVVQLGRNNTRRQMLIGLLMGSAINQIGARPLWRMIDQLPLASATAAARRLENLQVRDAEFAVVLHDETDYQVAQLEKQYSNKMQRAKITSLFRERMNAEIDKAHLPYSRSDRQAKSDDFEEDGEDIFVLDKKSQHLARPTEIVDRQMRSNERLFASCRFNFNLRQARQALLTTALALRAYRLRHGAYPSTLRDLSPQILKTVPHDSFSDGAVLQYRLEKSYYRLWSTGPDGIDDAGREIFNAVVPNEVRLNSQEYYRRLPQLDSRGDIVAGINP